MAATEGRYPVRYYSTSAAQVPMEMYPHVQEIVCLCPENKIFTFKVVPVKSEASATA